MRRLAGLLALACLAGSGCGAPGPEVRVTSDPQDWAPARVTLLPPVAAAAAIPPGTTYPEGVTGSTLPEAMVATASAIMDSLRTSTTLMEMIPAGVFTRTETAGLVEIADKEYLDARMVDPAVARALGEALGTDAYLLTAILRYGPEVDGDAQQVSKGVSTPLQKTTDLGINVASSYIIVYYNAQVRVALVRSSDGAILWDAASRQRERRGALRTVTQGSVLKAAADTLARGFPWRRVETDDPAH